MTQPHITEDSPGADLFPEYSSLYDLIYLGPSHLARARIHTDLGETDPAINCYQEFLSLWSEADPEMREQVEEARRSMTGLRKQSGC